MLQCRSSTATTDCKTALVSSLATCLPVLVCVLCGAAWYVTSNWLAGVFFAISAGLLVRARWLEHISRVRLAMACNIVPHQIPSGRQFPLHAALAASKTPGWIEQPVSHDA